MEATATSAALVSWINAAVKDALAERRSTLSAHALEALLRERIDPHFDLKAARGHRGHDRRPRPVTRGAVD